MNKLLKKFFIVLFIGGLIFTFSGCGNDEERNAEEDTEKSGNDVSTSVENSKTEETQVTGAHVADGLYDMVLRADDVELSAGDICLEIKDGKISIGNGFAGSAETGTYEIKGNKLVGKYDTLIYIDHTKGGEYTEEAITEEFDFDILEDGSLRDNKGFGAPLDNLQFSGRIYRLTEAY